MLWRKFVLLPLTVVGDMCNDIALRFLRVSSFCDLESRTCHQLFWESSLKQWLIIAAEPFGDVQPVACEGEEFPSIDSSDGDAAIEEICDTLNGDILPAALRIPVRSIATKSMQKIHKLLWRIKAAPLSTDEVFRALKSCEVWPEWDRLIREWLNHMSAAKFHDSCFLASISPFLHLHSDIVTYLFPSESGEFALLNSPHITGFLESCTCPYLQVASPTNDPVPVSEESLSEIVARVMSQEWSSEELVDRMEWFAQTRNEAAILPLCSFIDRVAQYIALVRPEPWRRLRLIFTLADMCKSDASLSTRRNLIDLVSDSFSGVYGGSISVHMLMPSIDADLIRSSVQVLEDLANDLFRYSFTIQYADTPARGTEGPRNQWIGRLVEHYFNVESGVGVFEYSDESRQFIKPSKSAKKEALRAAGRLIGLCIRYGLTMGVELTQLAISQLQVNFDRIPAEDLERETHEEDPAFFAGLNKFRQMYLNGELEELSLIMEQTADSIDNKSVDAFILEELYRKCIASIRSQMLVISEGIRDAVPPGTLQLFTQEELTLMIRGTPNLSPETLLRGIAFKGTHVPLFDWLVELVAEADDRFRFALNKFVTGVPQPPLGRDGRPWIFVSINPESTLDRLPTTQNCFGNLLLPFYDSKEILRTKLELAVFEGAGSLELY